MIHTDLFSVVSIDTINYLRLPWKLLYLRNQLILLTFTADNLNGWNGDINTELHIILHSFGGYPFGDIDVQKSGTFIIR